ncbi:MAG: DUF4179 domain-containing protein [Lachnospiraceae bacterium]|nr:DUF4179 domain-containing protein [Lachnospiraceae bacterium]
MSIKGYKNAFWGIEPSKELHDSLLQAVLNEENEMKIEDRGEKRVKRSRRVRARMIAACAAVMILCVSMTAAAAFDFNEIFQGFFKKETVVEEEGKNEVSAVPLEAGDDFLASAGNVIQEETVGNGLKLTLRGTVGDGNALYAALDVETEDGSPFSEEQESSVQSYRFEEVMLEGEGIGGDGIDRCYCGLERIDDGSVPGKATFLLSEVFENDLKGKEIKMSLRNLMAESNEIVDMGMDKTIWELIQEFEPLEICEGSNAGLEIGMYTEETDADSNMERHESFMVEKTDKRIAFSSKYPKARISNMGIFRGQYADNLIVNLDFGGEFDWDLLDQKSLIVMDRRTGQVLNGSSEAMAIGNGTEEGYFPGMEGQADIVGEDYVSCRYCFNDISESQAKNAVFALDGDGSYDELFGGEWTLSFRVDYEDTMKAWKLQEKTAVGNIEIKKVQISPVSAVLEFDILSDDTVEFDDVSLKLKNGNQVKWNAMSWDEEREEAKSCRILWKSVVDLEDIEGIIVNGTEIAL